MPNDLPGQADPIVFMDIETLPADEGDSIWEKIQDQSPLPKDQDFDAYFEEKRKDTALFPALGRVWMIGFAHKAEEPVILECDGTIDGEARLLGDFFNHIKDWDNPWWVGHNVSGFDVPFLQVRALHHQLPALARKMGRLRAKPWEQRVLDTQKLWPATGADRYSHSHGIRGTRRLDTVCSILGVENQTGVMGPDVYAAYLAGDKKGVMDHLYQDVIQVREVFKHLWPIL
jgi:uncharacterized protein YprB with RNaseH-like and TPR domain